MYIIDKYIIHLHILRNRSVKVAQARFSTGSKARTKQFDISDDEQSQRHYENITSARRQ